MSSSATDTAIDDRISSATAHTEPPGTIDSLGQRRAILKSAPRFEVLAVGQQLGGTLERHWLPQGLRLEMQLRCDQLTA